MEKSRQKLTARRYLALALVLALGIPTVFSLLPGCESTPAEPEFNNPFDPLGPDGGDPLQVQAEAANDTTIQLSWNQPQNLGLTHYIISRSAYRDSGWSEVGNKDHTTAPIAQYPYTNPTPTSTIWFRVQAFAGDNFSIASYAIPDSATTGPRVIVGARRGTTATRFVNLRITVTRGDQLHIALDPGFTDSLKIVPAGASGVPVDLTYDLGPVPGNSQTKTLYTVAIADGYQSVVSSQTIRVDFNPAFKVAGDPKTLATRSVDLTIPTEGVLNMRFFADWADSAATPWVAPADTYAGYQLSDSANPQFIRAQFQGDFGFIDDQEIKVTPDLLTDISFALAPQDSAQTGNSTVLGISRAVATQMRWSETADFTGAPWTAFDDTVTINLSPAPGRKVIHVQYRNDWTQSGILTDYVIHVAQPAEVTFWAPQEGDVILGGSVFQVRGGSTVGSGAGSVSLVKFDAGDGSGFANATGTGSWSYLWNVPKFNANTPLTIRAQAWYGPIDTLETVTTAITVTVTQLVASIKNPADGAVLIGNRTVTLTGTAVGVLGGAPVDSVTIDIGPDHLLASGTANWTSEWTAPLSETDVALSMTATAWASGDTAAAVISVNVVRPPVAVTEPVDGDLVDGDIDLAIAGRTFADLFPVTVDSVEVFIAWSDTSVTLPAAGTGSWSALWRTPTVAANTKADIIATAFAGSESRADTISVTVKP